MAGPDWTDDNPHDPGAPLLQLFPFLGEQLLFRAGLRRLVAVGLAVGVGLVWWRRRRDG